MGWNIKDVCHRESGKTQTVTIQLAWILLQDKARGAENRSVCFYT